MLAYSLNTDQTPIVLDVPHSVGVAFYFSNRHNVTAMPHPYRNLLHQSPLQRRISHHTNHLARALSPNCLMKTLNHLVRIPSPTNRLVRATSPICLVSLTSVSPTCMYVCGICLVLHSPVPSDWLSSPLGEKTNCSSPHSRKARDSLCSLTQS